jgi:hypothetical protein
MTATNIVIDEFIEVLMQIRAGGARLMNLDMIQDESHPSMNKLIIHPIPVESEDKNQPKGNSKRLIIKNPDVSTDNNDIFNSLNDLL